jgi:hypothetical protein
MDGTGRTMLALCQHCPASAIHPFRFLRHLCPQERAAYILSVQLLHGFVLRIYLIDTLLTITHGNHELRWDGKRPDKGGGWPLQCKWVRFLAGLDIDDHNLCSGIVSQCLPIGRPHG